jgi:aminoglycoside N3'-acetyltransferase
VTSTDSVANDLRTLGVHDGGVLVVHMSFRAVRPVEGGPAGVIDALRAAVGEDGTIVMPSWGDDDSVPFDVAETKVAEDLGVTAEVFRRIPDARRSNHPFAFAALGPRAAEIVRDPLPIPPHCLASPIGRAWELDAQVLLLGVGHDANTTVHLAEIMAGVPYGVPKFCTTYDQGRVDYVENDSCCQGFSRVGDVLRARGLEHVGRVGSAEARLMRARDVVDVALELLRRDPFALLHAKGAGCEDCDAAHTSTTA